MGIPRATERVRRLYVTAPEERDNDLFRFVGGFLDADWEAIEGNRRTLCNPKEAGLPDGSLLDSAGSDIPNDYASTISFGLMERIVGCFGSLVTTLGYVYEEPEMIDRAEGRVLLNLEEMGGQTIAVERPAKLHQANYVRAFGNVGSPTLLCSLESLDVERALPLLPLKNNYRCLQLCDIDHMMEDESIFLAISTRDYDYTIPLEFLARGKRVAKEVFRTLRAEPDFVVIAPGYEEAKFVEESRDWLLYYLESNSPWAYRGSVV